MVDIGLVMMSVKYGGPLVNRYGDMVDIGVIFHRTYKRNYHMRA